MPDLYSAYINIIAAVAVMTFALLWNRAANKYEDMVEKYNDLAKKYNAKIKKEIL